MASFFDSSLASIQSFTILLLIIWTEIDANAIHTMPLVLRVPKPLALEDVSQVSPAVIAYDLGAHHAQSAVLMPSHGPRDAVEVGGPATPRLEFVVGLVERRAASSARVDAIFRVMLIVLAGVGRLGAFLAQDAEVL